MLRFYFRILFPVIVALSALFLGACEETTPAVPYLGGIVIGLSTLLTVVIVSSGIFEGGGRVSPGAIERTLTLIDTHDAASATSTDN